MDEQKEPVRTASQLYSLGWQGLKGLGESGLSEYDDAKFIDRKTGKVHMSTCLVISHDLQWSSDGERVFFNGFLYDMLAEEEDPYFVVMDVKSRLFLHVFHGYAEHPRWNALEMDALFDNELKPAFDTITYLERQSRWCELERDLPVLHLENEEGFMADGKKFLAESFSPRRTYMVRFYKVSGLWRDDFEVAFWVYRKKNGQWWRIERWKMPKNMINGVDGFAWIDDETIIYSVLRNKARWTKSLKYLF